MWNISFVFQQFKKYFDKYKNKKMYAKIRVALGVCFSIFYRSQFFISQLFVIFVLNLKVIKQIFNPFV